VSTDVATVGLFYDSEDLQRADLGVFCRIVKGLNEPPTVRGTDSIVPALAGRIEGLRINDVLPIELECWVQPDADETTSAGQMSSFRTNQKDLRALFAPNRQRATLLAVLEDGTFMSIQARPLNVIWNELIPSVVASASVALEGYDDWAEVVGS
jgi:hypothetical protein